MVRKRRSALPASGGSEAQEGSGDRADEQPRQMQQPTLPPAQGGRGSAPQPGAYTGAAGLTGRGFAPPGHQQGLGAVRQHEVPSVAAVSGAPARTPDPELHRSTHNRPIVASSHQQGGSVETGTSDQLHQLSLQPPSQPASRMSMRFPSRPGLGTKGTKCMVKANHFFVEIPDKDLHHYDVTITPEVKRAASRLVIGELVNRYKESSLGNRLPVYDGRKSLYTAGPLPFGSKEFEVTLADEDDGRSNTMRRQRKFKVVIKFAARADLHHLKMFLCGRQPDAPQEALQVLDIVLRELPTSKYCPVGRSFYSPNLGRKLPLGGGLESWRGFYQSIRPTQMGLSLNIDMSSSAFMEAIQVIDFVCQHLNKDVSAGPLSRDDYKEIKRALRNVRIEVTHRGSLRRRYRIFGLSSQPTRDLRFPIDEGGTMKSVVEYFSETYGFSIQHTQLPCLLAGNPQRPSFLPMEVCKIVEGQKYSARLNQKQVTALLKATCQRPQDRENDIIRTFRRNNYANDRFAMEFGIRIRDEMSEVEARVLPPPMLKYHDSGLEKQCLPVVGQWSMDNKRMVNGGQVNSWACINFARNIPANVARKFCSELAAVCAASGMVFNPNPIVPLVTARPDCLENVLKSTSHDAMQKLPPEKKELDLLIVLLAERGSLYGDLKRICETELGIVSQCCLQKHVFEMKNRYLANLALKINVKVGGRNTVLCDAISRRIPLVTDVPTIIFGADVTHPSPGEDSSPSIAAVVASQDWPEVSKYTSLVSAQTHRKELIHDLYKTYQDPKKGTCHGGMVRELLVSFFKTTGQKPKRIIFYRDGVSEGQFSQVLLHEVDAIRKACASLEPNYQPPITFVVVQKRHHTRLFASNHGDRRTVDRSGNILPGTVVDSRICHPTEFDFYLCSHSGIQGTSRPAHYHVLWDENNFSADGLQLLTYSLCYTYARCTRSVSIVPPAYYAHQAAFRARYYMDPQSSDSGSISGGRGARSSRGPDFDAGVKPLPQVRENVKRVMFYC